MADSLEGNKEVFVTRVIPLIGVTFLLVTAYATYTQFQHFQSGAPKTENVLGEKTAENQVVKTVCNSNEALASKLQEKNVVIPLLAPDKQSILNVSEIAPCVSFPTCTSEQNCDAVEVQVDRECLAAHFEAVPLELTENIEVTGEGKTVQVRKQDWVVSYADMVQKVSTLVESEVNYCDLKGEVTSGKSKLSLLTVPVTDILPSVSKTFATKFLEIDNSKEKAYYWTNGSYQEFRMLRGTEAGANSIVKRNAIDMAKLFGARDATYLAKNLNATDLVVVHE